MGKLLRVRLTKENSEIVNMIAESEDRSPPNVANRLISQATDNVRSAIKPKPKVSDESVERRTKARG